MKKVILANLDGWNAFAHLLSVNPNPDKPRKQDKPVLEK
jgi:hypothetical protein